MSLILITATFMTAYCRGALTKTQARQGGGGGMAGQRLHVHGGELQVSKKTCRFELAGARWNSKQKIVKYSHRSKEDE